MIRSERLDCGLTLVTEEMPEVASAAAGYWVGTGGRDELAPVLGASHFIEHLAFKGTPSRSAADIARALDAVGGEMNAFTTKESTAFYVRLLAEDLDLGLDVLCDIMWSPLLAEADLEAERQVVLEEILMHADEPADVVHELAFDALFPGHPLGRDVLGTTESVGAMRAGDLRAFFCEHYRPENMVVSVAGRIDHGRVAAGLEERFAGVPGGARPSRSAPADPPRALSVSFRDTEQAHIVVAMRSPRRGDRRRHALDVLDHVLGGGLSSRLFQEVRERRGLAYSVYSERAAFEDAGALSVYVGTAPSKAHEALAVVRDELDRLAAYGVSEEELEVAKGFHRAQSLLALEDSGSRMSRIGRSQLAYGEVLPVEELLRRVDAVGLDDVADAARFVLGGPRSLAVVGPFGEEDFEWTG